MYEPFEQAIDQFVPHPEHKVSLEVFQSRLEECDGCQGRNEMVCEVNPRCRKCSIIAKAQRVGSGLCGWGRWQ